MKNRMISLILAAVLLLSLVPAAYGEEAGFAEKRSGYDIATIRFEKGDGSYTFLNFTEAETGYTYVRPQGEGIVKVEYFSITAWDGAVDISWYDATKSEFYLSTPAQLAGLAALVNGSVDIPDYRIKGDQSLLVNHQVDDFLLVGAGGGNVTGTVYVADSANDFSDKAVYLTTDMDMGGSANWTPIGGKYPMDATNSDHVIEAFFNGTLDGQGHRIFNLRCDRYAAKGYAYSQAVGLVGYLGELYEGEKAPLNPPAVRNLSLNGSIYGRRMVGGIVGRVGSIPTGVYIENCANFAEVKNTDSKGIGGIVGAGWGKGAIVNCYNAGDVTTTYACPAGGICGSNSGMDIFNCYNVGKIDSHGNGRGRAIGSHDKGSYTVSDCYYLEGCDDDSASNGYYQGTALSIQVDIKALSQQELQQSNFVTLLNSNGNAYLEIPNAYPVLWWEKQAAELCDVTLVQPAGGQIFAHCPEQVSAGTVVHLSNAPTLGYSFQYYTLNGRPLSGSYATVTETSVLSAKYDQLTAGSLVIEPHPACEISVVKDGTVLENGSPKAVTNYPVKNGDPLYEGDRLTATAQLFAGAEPEDLSYIYSGSFRYQFSFTGSEADPIVTDSGRFTVTKDIISGSLLLSVEPYTVHKAWTQVADTGWYDESKTEFTLTSARQLAGLALLVKNGNTFTEKTVHLGADISLSNDDKTYNRSVRYWDGIGTLSAPFSGTFDGCGYKITQMTAINEAGGSAFILFTKNANILNFTVYGESQGNGFAAGIVSQAVSTTIENCFNYASVTSTNEKAGGIVAQLDGNSTVLSCSSYGKIQGTAGIGGIAGVVADEKSTLSDCKNFGEVIGDGSATGLGGVAGRIGGKLVRCANYGKVSGKGWYVGGIVGVSNNQEASRLTDCYNVGTVSNAHTYAQSGTGGLVGYGNHYTLENCFSYCKVTAEAGAYGGIIGKDSKRSTNSVNNCYYLNTCSYAANSEPTTKGITALSAEAFIDSFFLNALNQNHCFVIKNGKYPELAEDGDIIPVPVDEIYTDVPNDAWFLKAVQYVYDHKLMNGVAEGCFAPESPMTRAMLVTVLWRYAGSPAPVKAVPFEDVPQGQWYTEAVAWANENQVVNGTSPTTFSPDSNITREQMATILYRYAKGVGADTGKQTGLDAFPDGATVSPYALKALRWCVAEGIIGGSDGHLLPQGNATRAQVATILMRFLSR